MSVESADTNVFLDYAVFTFVPATAAALPMSVADRRYHVFEDGNWIGELSPTAGDSRGRASAGTIASANAAERWEFRHADDDWPALAVEHAWRGDRWVLEWNLRGLPDEKSFAGARTGFVTLSRRTLHDLEISTFSWRRHSPDEVEKERAVQDGMSLVFLLDKYPRFYNLLYQSYNVVAMDPWNLFRDGVRTTEPVLREPENSFGVDTANHVILPHDLEILQQELKLDHSTSRVVTTASEYNAAVTSRIAAGVSGSFTFGTGAGLPWSASGTVNMSVVVAGETTKSRKKIIRTNWNPETFAEKAQVLLAVPRDHPALGYFYLEVRAAISGHANARAPDGARRPRPPTGLRVRPAPRSAEMVRQTATSRRSRRAET